VLRHLPPITDPRILVGTATSDDAAVYRLNDEQALVSTVDFFTPIVDNAYDFGRIAAANALSDIYAMGATPLYALALVAFPRDLLADGQLEEITRGGVEKALEAGCPIVGGHSIDDAEPKYGLSVTGIIHPDRIVRNVGARPGDRLFLTKPIGTGIIATAIKRDLAPADVTSRAVDIMSALNRPASEAMVEIGVSAATDVTGYGLLGHLLEMVSGSGAGARISFAAVPLIEGTVALAELGAIPGGTRRNEEAIAPSVSWDPSLSPVQQAILADAQTSGGLLLAVPYEKADALKAVLRRKGVPAVAEIGEIVDGAGITVMT
jgi:selenide,water dikinase